MLDVYVSILLSVSLRNRFQIFLFRFFLRLVANISVFACVCFVSNVGTTVATDEAIFIHLPWTVVSATVSESRVTLTTLACAWIVIVASIAVSYNTELNNQPTLWPDSVEWRPSQPEIIKGFIYSCFFCFFFGEMDRHTSMSMFQKERNTR